MLREYSRPNEAFTHLQKAGHDSMILKNPDGGKYDGSRDEENRMSFALQFFSEEPRRERAC
jgi:hypothetical protein